MARTYLGPLPREIRLHNVKTMEAAEMKQNLERLNGLAQLEHRALEWFNRTCTAMRSPLSGIQAANERLIVCC